MDQPDPVKVWNAQSVRIELPLLPLKYSNPTFSFNTQMLGNAQIPAHVMYLNHWDVEEIHTFILYSSWPIKVSSVVILILISKYLRSLQLHPASNLRYSFVAGSDAFMA